MFSVAALTTIEKFNLFVVLRTGAGCRRKLQAQAAGAGADPSQCNSTNAMGNIHLFSKIARPFEPMMQFNIL